MKIYFDGCSWTRGVELENEEEERFSRLICNELGAEETNLGKGGGSNDRIIRNLIVENNIEEYDYAVIQMTYPARTEYLDHKWRHVNPCGHPPILKEHLAGDISQETMCIIQEFVDRSDFNFTKWLSEKKGGQNQKFRHHSDFWTYYYTKICNSNYFHTKEKIQYETIKSYCKSKGVPLILCSINEWSKLNFDYPIRVKKKYRAEHGHPNKEGHRLIAKVILDKI